MKIAIVKLSALGDIIHAMVVLQFIKQRYPKAIIDWVVEAGFKDILENNPHINQIHTVDLKQAKQQRSIKLLFKELLKVRQFKRYDLVIDAQGLLKSAIIAKLIPSEQTWGFDKYSIREKIASYFYSNHTQIAYAANTIDRNIKIICNALDMQISRQDILNKHAFLFSLNKQASHQIVLVLGASFVAKQYPVEKFAQFVGELKANYLVIWGNEKEYKLAQQLQASVPTVEISPKLNLGELIGLIENAYLVIGGDTGPTHMAWALNTPSVALFGATLANRNCYQTPINQVIESKSSVNPYHINKNDYSIAEIEVAEIAKIAKELLALA